jgi:hypothetical protein
MSGIDHLDQRPIGHATARNFDLAKAVRHTKSLGNVWEVRTVDSLITHNHSDLWNLVWVMKESTAFE